MNMIPKADLSAQWIRVRDIRVVWPAAQRPLKEAEAKRIAEDFDPDSFGTITVCAPNSNGIYHCIDGQTRTMAAFYKFGEEHKVLCVVTAATDKVRAAEIFGKINGGRSKPSALSMFLVNLTAQRSTEVAVNKIVGLSGYRITQAMGQNSLRCVSALLQVYRRHGEEVLSLTLNTIRRAWGSDDAATDACLVRGMAAFIAQFGEDIDLEQFSRKLARKFTAPAAVGAIHQIKKLRNWPLDKAAVDVLLDAHNQGLRSGKLTAKK